MKRLFHWNYWYSARADEIFLDLDSNRAISRALSVLRVAIRETRDRLGIRAVWLYSTSTPHHAHMIIRLCGPMSWADKLAWSLWLGNDRLRVAYILQRWDRGLQHGDLLISKYPYYRKHDALCLCTEKHKKPEITEACAAMAALLGDERSADYFARTGKAPSKRRIRVPWGKVSLTQIKNWSEVYERDERLLQDNGPKQRLRRVQQIHTERERTDSGSDSHSAMASKVHAGDSATTCRGSNEPRQDH